VIRTTKAVRLGFRQIKGISEADMLALVAARREGYHSVRDLWLRSGIGRGAIEKLADADAFGSLDIDRRDALWAARALSEGGAAEKLPLFEAIGDQDGQAASVELQNEPHFPVPRMTGGEAVVQDYRSLSLSLNAHPVEFLRQDLARAGIVTAATLENTGSGRMVSVCGVVLVRQRPGSAKGVIFMTLEDETGVANIIVWPKVFAVYRSVVLGSRLVEIKGRLQKADGVIHVVAAEVVDRSPMLARLSEAGASFETLSRADEVKHPVVEQRINKARTSTARELFREMPELVDDIHRVMPKGRNFQ
jgi:DNA polymerase III alpha subunit